MEEQESSPKRRLEKKPGTSIFALLILVVVLLLAALFFLKPFIEPPEKASQGAADISSQQASTPAAPSDQTGSAAEPPPPTDNRPVDQSDVQREPSSDQILTDPEPSHPAVPADHGEEGATDEPIREAEAGIVEADPCAPHLDRIETFFETLDQRAYIRDFELGAPSSIYFPRLVQRLIDNPPVVTGETDDLYTVLQNTAHFFRVIGKKNILVIKGILDREKDTFEQILADFFELTHRPGCLEERFNLGLEKESLYLYSGFFLNTMGGRLYLFRRDSMSRMVVNFYAIRILDEAIREGRNRYGIPIAPAIDSLIAEIESSRIELQMRDHYLDTLYDLKERYQ